MQKLTQAAIAPIRPAINPTSKSIPLHLSTH